MDYTCDLFLLFSSRTEIWYLPKPRLSTSTRLFFWLFAAKNQEQCGGIWKKTNSPSKKAPPSTAGPSRSSSKSDSNPDQAQLQAQPVPETPSSSSSEVEPKKERQFKTSWKVNRPWLKYEEGLMFCLFL